MKDELTRYSHRNSSPPPHSAVPDNYRFTDRVRESPAVIKQRINTRESDKNRTKAFVLAQKKAKKAGEVKYFAAIPSLENECGYRLGDIGEVHSSKRTAELVDFWVSYCAKYDPSVCAKYDPSVENRISLTGYVTRPTEPIKEDSFTAKESSVERKSNNKTSSFFRWLKAFFSF